MTAISVLVALGLTFALAQGAQGALLTVVLALALVVGVCSSTAKSEVFTHSYESCTTKTCGTQLVMTATSVLVALGLTCALVLALAIGRSAGRQVDRC
jgi:uncharacterized protein HemY